MNKEEYKELLDDFRSMCPWAAKTIKRYWISGHMEITAELKDGSAIKYDGVLRAFRWAANLEELAAISRPRNEAEWKQQFCLRLWHVMLSKGMTQQDLSQTLQWLATLERQILLREISLLLMQVKSKTSQTKVLWLEIPLEQVIGIQSISTTLETLEHSAT